MTSSPGYIYILISSPVGMMMKVGSGDFGTNAG